MLKKATQAWSNMAPAAARKYAAVPFFIRDVYIKARSYDDVVFGDQYPVKIIEHLLTEWTWGSKYFNMAILGYCNTVIWKNLEGLLD